MRRTTKRKTKPAPWTTVPQFAKAARVGVAPKGARSEPKRRSRVRPRSKALEASTRLYRAKAEAYKLAHPFCSRPGCTRKTSDVHHTRGRSGVLLLMQEWWVPVCRKCHDWIASNPEAARAQGLLCEKGKWGDPR